FDPRTGRIVRVAARRLLDPIDEDLDIEVGGTFKQRLETLLVAGVNAANVADGDREGHLFLCPCQPGQDWNHRRRQGGRCEDGDPAPGRPPALWAETDHPSIPSRIIW